MEQCIDFRPGQYWYSGRWPLLFTNVFGEGGILFALDGKLERFQFIKIYDRKSS
jgi:hypothetical protein